MKYGKNRTGETDQRAGVQALYEGAPDLNPLLHGSLHISYLNPNTKPGVTPDQHEIWHKNKFKKEISFVITNTEAGSSNYSPTNYY